MPITTFSQGVTTFAARPLQARIGYAHASLVAGGTAAAYADVTVTTAAAVTANATTITLSAAPANPILAGVYVTFNNVKVRVAATTTTTTMTIDPAPAGIASGASGTWTVLPFFPGAAEMMPNTGDGQFETISVYGASADYSVKTGRSLTSFTLNTISGSANVCVSDLIQASQFQSKGSDLSLSSRRFAYFALPDGAEVQGWGDVGSANPTGAPNASFRYSFSFQWSEPPRFTPSLNAI